MADGQQRVGISFGDGSQNVMQSSGGESGEYNSSMREIFVGRVEEMALLDRAFEESLSGHGLYVPG